MPAFLFLCGLECGGYLYARPEEITHITTVSIVAFSILGVLRWWSGSEPAEPADDRP